MNYILEYNSFVFAFFSFVFFLDGFLWIPAAAYSVMFFYPDVVKYDLYRELFFSDIEKDESGISFFITLSIALVAGISFFLEVWHVYQIAFLTGTIIVLFVVFILVIEYYGVFYSLGKFTDKIINKH